MFIGIVAVLIVAAVICFIVSMNNLKTAEVKVEEALSGIDVALTKRYDTLKKMADTVKSYVKYEEEALFKIVEMRSGMNMADRKEAAESMNETTGRINFLAEEYPELKASENFLQFQAAIADVEEHLQASRRLYNSNVSRFNQLCVTFPSSIVANMLKMEQRDFFEANEIKREDFKVEL